MRSRVRQMERLGGQIEHLEKQLAGLKGQLAKVSAPILTDYALLPYIWASFVDFSKRHGHDPQTVYERRKFLFVALVLYDPMALVGKRIRQGLRKKLARAMDISDMTQISHSLRNVLFFYDTYRDFSREVDYFYIEISERLQASQS